MIEDGRLSVQEARTPQGGLISPLPVNVYLHVVLDMWFERAMRAQLKGRMSVGIQ